LSPMLDQVIRELNVLERDAVPSGSAEPPCIRSRALFAWRRWADPDLYARGFQHAPEHPEGAARMIGGRHHENASDPGLLCESANGDSFVVGAVDALGQGDETLVINAGVEYSILCALG